MAKRKPATATIPAPSKKRRRKPKATQQRRSARRRSEKKVTTQFLVTGVSGQLGHAILHEIGEDNCIAKNRESLDITDHQQVSDQLDLLKPDMVIHTAAYTGVENAEADRDGAWKVNAAATDNLVKCCALDGIPLIHISDAQVFGQKDYKSNGFREVDPICPISWYAQTKAMGEQALMGLSQSMNTQYWNYGFRYWLIRTSELIERPWRAAKNQYQMLAQTAMAATRGQRQPLARDIIRSFTYVPHLAKAIAWLAHNWQEVVSGVYHIANQGVTTPYDFMSEVLRHGNSEGIEPTTLQRMCLALDVDPKLVPRYSSLNCDKWHEIAPCRMPGWKLAAREFGQALAGK